ncbi:MAG: ribonuclease Z [Proteobacteria bacterium]|nr:ribonuclease Z [Pseudomonadota bacterium]
MIEVIFLGVGEAFDEKLPNTSILIRYRDGTPPVTLLLDCGFSAPSQFWKEEPDADILDGIWISHFHGDHCLGVPALLVRFWEEGRKKALTLLGQKGIDAFTRTSLDLAYPGIYERLGFPLKFLEVEPEKYVTIFGLVFQAAVNSHSQRDLALRIDAQEKSIYYSGDGKATPESMALAKGSQLIIHEAFSLEAEIPGHGTVTGSIKMAKECRASNLALVHIQRKVRSQVIDEMQKFTHIAGSLNLLVPEPGFRITL